jgi:hypothetical protein
MKNAPRERRGRRRRRIALAVSGPAAALVAAAAPAWAGSNAPSISFSEHIGPGVPAFDWALNRQSKAIESMDCTLDGQPASCGTLALSSQAVSSKSTTFVVSDPRVICSFGGTYIVNVRLSDHTTVSATPPVGDLQRSGISIGDMFEMQMLSNYCSQVNM